MPSSACLVPPPGVELQCLPARPFHSHDYSQIQTNSCSRGRLASKPASSTLSPPAAAGRLCNWRIGGHAERLPEKLRSRDTRDHLHSRFSESIPYCWQRRGTLQGERPRRPGLAVEPLLLLLGLLERPCKWPGAADLVKEVGRCVCEPVTSSLRMRVQRTISTGRFCGTPQCAFLF